MIGNHMHLRIAPAVKLPNEQGQAFHFPVNVSNQDIGAIVAETVHRFMAEHDEQGIFVLGWIGYRDDLGIFRQMGFCRRYESRKDRFVPVDDPDYEYSD